MARLLVTLATRFITCATKHVDGPGELECARPVQPVFAVNLRFGREHAGVISLVMQGRASPRLDRQCFVSLLGANGRD